MKTFGRIAATVAALSAFGFVLGCTMPAHISIAIIDHARAAALSWGPVGIAADVLVAMVVVASTFWPKKG